MCGRFTLSVPPEELAVHFELESVPPPEGLEARYNIAPTQFVAAVRLTRAGARRLELLRWGLVPHWARDTSIAPKLINARAETLIVKPAFRGAFRRRRCLIPASGFYEWQKLGKKKKQPFLIRSAAHDGAPLAFAGLWERWGKDDATVDSCTIVTVDAVPELAEIHPRMPAILRPEQFEAWLARPDDDAEVDVDALQALLRPTTGLQAIKVSTQVNDVRRDDATCIEPLADDTSEASDEPSAGDLPLLDRMRPES
jgi:putative SOS response-associated peptidase YedK